jgi:putative cardiolipin synthase
MLFHAHSLSAAQRCLGIVVKLLCVAAVLLASACSSLPENYPRTESTALEDHRSTSMGKRWGALEDQHPGKSGFDIIRYGRVAFTTRIGMIDRAEKSIDLQVYIWEADETGRILAERLVSAADRGVRVRLLVDDMGKGPSDQAIASMDAHPNIEIRIFNPFAYRGAITFDFVTDLNRVNHRMHNKIIIADNSFAVVGGRNVGDHYFSVNPDTNFRDLDIATVGPLVRDISGVFDHFWQSKWAVPISVLVDRAYTEEDLRAGMAELRQKIAAGSYPYVVDDDVQRLAKHFEIIEDRIIWATGRVVWDDPQSAAETGKTVDIIRELRKKLNNVETSFSIESAYFVIGKGGVERFAQLVDQGVKVRVLTNSLVSNDVLAAHAGHANYRKELLEAGVEVFELRPDSGVIWENSSGKASAGLHTKALAFDNESVFIGSFNLDPRSAAINTEAGLYVESPELTARLLEYMDEGVEQRNSYRLMLDDDGDLLWVTKDDGVEVRYHKDPLSTFGQRFSAGFIRILPVEGQL